MPKHAESSASPGSCFVPIPFWGGGYRRTIAFAWRFAATFFSISRPMAGGMFPGHRQRRGRVSHFMADEETFTALLQRDMPDVRILNRGIGGHGSVQNLLQLRRDIAAGAIDAAVFSVISDHRFRNIAHPQRMRQYLSAEWYKLRVEHVPVAQLDGKGQVQIVYREIWQPALRDVNFGVFLPDDHMVNLVTLAVLELVRETARAAGIPLHFALLDSLDRDFNSAVCDRFSEALDISCPHDRQHTFQPLDNHPNMRANSLFAERLQPLIKPLLGKGPARRGDV